MSTAEGLNHGGGGDNDDQHRTALMARGFAPEEVDDLVLDLPSFSSSEEEEEEGDDGNSVGNGGDVERGKGGAPTGTNGVGRTAASDPHTLRERYARSLELMAAHAAHHWSEAEGLAGPSGRALLASLKEEPPTTRRIRYLDVANVDPASFTDEFVSGIGFPVMLTGVVEAGGWRAAERWASAEAFTKHYGDVPVKVWDVASVSGFGKPMPVLLPVSMYHEYTDAATADFPFYVFLKEFEPVHDDLLADYQVWA